MALAVCLLFDRRTEEAVRRLWQRLEEDGVPSLRSHTHGRHVPHLSYAVLREFDTDRVQRAVAELPDAGPITLHLDGLGLFRRSRSWLLPGLTADLAARQQQVVAAVEGTGADLHRHYRPGQWIPHVTLAPRAHLHQLPTIAAAVYDVLPLTARVESAALVDSATGELRPLPHLP